MGEIYSLYWPMFKCWDSYPRKSIFFLRGGVYFSLLRFQCKHCQRHNGPEGWVLSPKYLFLSNIKFQLQNLYQTSASKSWSNSASKSWPKFNLKISTKLQLQNLNQNSASKSWQNFTFNILTNIHVQNLYTSFKIPTKLSSTRSLESISATQTTSRRVKLASLTPAWHQSSLSNMSLVS